MINQGRVFAVVGLLALAAVSCTQEPSFVEQRTGSGGSGLDSVKDPAGGDGQNPGGEATGTPIPPDSTDIEPIPTIKLNYTFAADVLSQGTFTQSLAEPWSYLDITMSRLYRDETRTFRQAVRPRQIDTFTQNPMGTPRFETLQTSADRKVDILVVVDNSRSMAEEQKNLSTKLMPLIGALSKADWQIGVITSDTKADQGCLRDLITRNDVRPQIAFERAVMSAGIAGDGEEKPILAAVQGLTGTCKGVSKPWVRTGSTLSVLIVSDEDNCHMDKNYNPPYGCKDQPYRWGEYLTNYLTTIRTLGKDARVYGLFWHPTQPQTSCPTGLKEGIEFQKVIEASSGRWGSICEADYSTTLTGISSDILVALHKSFPLRYTPDAGTLQVWLNGEPVSTGWRLVDKLIEFDTPPAEGTEVRFTYNVGGLPPQSVFALSAVARPSELVIEVDGQVIAPQQYVYDPTQKTVSFYVPPAAGARVRALYYKEVPMQKAFSVGKKIKTGTMRVQMNGNPVLDYALDEETGQVTFVETPPEGAAITLSYTLYGTPILNYPFMGSSGDPVRLSAWDVETNVPLAVGYALRQLRFIPEEWVEGRQVKVRFYNEARLLTKVSLPSPVVPTSVQATAGGVTCAGANISVAPNYKDITVVDCGFPTAATEVSLVYDFPVEHTSAFTLDALELPEPEEWVSLRVLVNDVATKSYTREGRTFTILGTMPPGAVVEFQVHVLKLAPTPEPTPPPTPEPEPTVAPVTDGQPVAEPTPEVTPEVTPQI